MDKTRIELVSPYKESDIYPLLKKYSNTPYHVCYEVENLTSATEYLQDKGFLIFKEAQWARAISQTAKVVFLIHTRMGMIELVEL
jgi:methylmalonyl-CoA/ethylmalonyl-CoA epimerase